MTSDRRTALPDVDDRGLMLIDHQTGVLERVVKAPFTTSEEDGHNRALPPLQQILPAACASRANRHGIIDSLADPAGDPEGRRRVRNCSRYVDVPAVQAAAY